MNCHHIASPQAIIFTLADLGSKRMAFKLLCIDMILRKDVYIDINSPKKCGNAQQTFVCRINEGKRRQLSPSGGHTKAGLEAPGSLAAGRAGRTVDWGRRASHTHSRAGPRRKRPDFDTQGFFADLSDRYPKSIRKNVLK